MVSVEKYLEFVASVLEVSVESLSLETAYESIPQWDSVMHLRLVMELGAEFNVDIPLEKVPELDTLAKFYEYVKG